MGPFVAHGNVQALRIASVLWAIRVPSGVLYIIARVSLAPSTQLNLGKLSRAE